MGCRDREKLESKNSWIQSEVAGSEAAVKLGMNVKVEVLMEIVVASSFASAGKSKMLDK
jgi:hypothetical protein